MNINIITIIILLLIMIILFIPINIRIIYDNTFSDIDVFLSKFIRHKFDLDEFIRKFTSYNNKISYIIILNNIELLINSKNILKDILKKTNIIKSTIILKNNYNDFFQVILFWNFIARIKCFLKDNFKFVNNEYYMVVNGNQEISIEMIFKIKIINILYSCLKNYKELFKIIRIKRRQKNGTSNM